MCVCVCVCGSKNKKFWNSIHFHNEFISLIQARHLKFHLMSSNK